MNPIDSRPITRELLGRYGRYGRMQIGPEEHRSEQRRVGSRPILPVGIRGGRRGDVEEVEIGGSSAGDEAVAVDGGGGWGVVIT